MTDSRDTVTLPSWQACSDKEDEGKHLTALERFIYDNEPAGTKEARKFRKQLTRALEGK